MNQTFSFVKKTTNVENKPVEQGKGFSFIKKTTPNVNESIYDAPEEKPSETNINNYNNLDQFLTENENILFGKVEKKEEEVKEKPSFGFIKKNEEQPKKGFNFITKKKEEDKPKVEDNDISEIKSIYSQTNNYVNDDISVNFEEETQKSVHDTSYCENKSLHEGLAKNNGSVKSDKAEPKPFESAPKEENTPKDNMFIKKVVERKDAKEEVVTRKIEEAKPKAEDMLQSKDALDNLIYKIHNVKIKIKDKNKEAKNLEELLEINIHKEEEAISNNDFDRAQEIENTVCETRERLQRIKLTLEELNKEMSKHRDSELVVIRHRAKVLEESINSSNQLYKSKQNEMIDYQNKESKKHNGDNIKITKLKEKLDFLQSNLKTEKDYIDEEDRKLNTLIKSQSSNIFDELDSLNNDKSSLLVEIEEIKKILDEKFSQLDIINRNIESKEIEIDAIKSNFNHDFNKMNYKKKNYEENLTDYNEQFNRYENMKKLYEADENKFNEKLKQFQDTITTLSSDILKLKDSLVNRNEELVLKDILFKRENEICVKLYLNQMKLNQAVENKEKHYNDIQNLEVNIKKLESEIMTIDLRIPNLEEEKKSYIAKKQFKDAGRVTNELVTLNKTKSMNIETIVFNKEKIENMRMNIENLDRDIIAISELNNAEQRELNMVRFEYLTLYIRQLEEYSVENNAIYVLEELRFVREDLANLSQLDYIREKFNLNKKEEPQESIHEKNEQSEEIKEDQQVEANEVDEKFDEDEIQDQNNEELSKEVNYELNNKDNLDEPEPEEQAEVEPETEHEPEPEPEPERKPEINREEIETRIKKLESEIDRCVEENEFERADEYQAEVDNLSKLLDQ